MATIQFAIPERPLLHTGLPASEEQESAFQRWLHELRTRREEQPLSDPWAEVPFLIATFGSVYAEFTLVRSLAIPGWIVDHTFWNGYGHAYDRHALVSIDSLETPLLFVSVSLGVLNWALLVARTRLCYYKASRWCQWLAYAQASLCVIVLHCFTHRTLDDMLNPAHVYSRGFWSCLCASVLTTMSGLGFTADWVMGYPYTRLSRVSNSLVLPSVMACTIVIVGALVFQWLEDWTYNEAVVFSWTAITTIGYGDIAPTTAAGRLFFIVYAFAGIGIAAYLFLSIRAVITGTSSDIIRVNLVRADSLRDYSRRQWLSHHPRKRTYSTFSGQSNFTVSGLLDKNREILVQIITRSGVIRMAVTLALSWLGSAAVFCLLEPDWTFMDAIYFTFATQLTIGFGDLVPETALAQEFWLLYIVLAIAVAAYFISLFGDWLVEKLRIQNDEEEENDDSSILQDQDIPGYVSLARALSSEPASIHATVTRHPARSASWSVTDERGSPLFRPPAQQDQLPEPLPQHPRDSTDYGATWRSQ